MRWICIIIFTLFFHISFSQEGDTKQLLAQAENIVYSNPQEAIRIAEYVSNTSEDTDQLIQAAYLLTRSFYIEGDYNNALKVGLKYSNDEFKNYSDNQLKLDVLLSKILKDLELNQLSERYMEKAIQESNKAKNEKIKHWLKGKVLQHNVISKSEETAQQSLKRLFKAKTEIEKIESDFHSFQLGNIDLEIATIHIREFQLDSVPYYLNTAFAESKNEKSGNYLEMKCLLEYGNYLFLKKQHIAAIDSLQSAERIAEKFTNIDKQMIISQAIADNYLALNDLGNFNLQNDKIKALYSSQTDVDNDAVNSAFNFITNNQTETLARTNFKFRQNIFLLGGIFFLMLLIWSFLAFRYRIRTKQYQSFIDYFEKKEEIPESTSAIKEKTIKHSVVPKEMEEKLLEKLNDFEKSTDFTKQETSLSRLALQFETNTKYLSEVVNFHKQKNFNTYINELRISYIINKLKNEPAYLQYKISYLAEDSGFSSHSLFATVFKSVTGIPPTTFISILRDKKESINQNQIKHAG